MGIKNARRAYVQNSELLRKSKENLGVHHLSKMLMVETRERQTDAFRQTSELDPQVEKEPFVFEEVECRANIPERRQDNDDFFSYPLQFGKKCIGIVNVLHGVRTQNTFKLFIRERQVIDVLHEEKIGELAIVVNVRVHSSAIRLSRTDVQIPFLSLENPILEIPIFKFVQEPKKDNHPVTGPRNFQPIIPQTYPHEGDEGFVGSLLRQGYGRAQSAMRCISRRACDRRPYGRGPPLSRPIQIQHDTDNLSRSLNNPTIRHAICAPVSDDGLFYLETRWSH